MLLRNGKKTTSTTQTAQKTHPRKNVAKNKEIDEKREAIVSELLKLIDSISDISFDDFIKRSEVLHKIFAIIHTNFEFIMSPGFKPSKKFITVVICKSKEIIDNYNSAQESYFERVRDKGLIHKKLLNSVYANFSECI